MRIRETTTTVILAILTLGTAVASASPVTYDFTGYTTTVTGSFDSLEGAAVSGSFTIDFDAAIASQSSGTPGSSASWASKASGGVNQSLPLPPALVFSESVTLNGKTYTSAPLSPFFSASSVSGETSDGELNAGVAFESPTLDITEWGSSFVSISPGKVTAYLSNGLPNLDAVDHTTSSGYFSLVTGSRSVTGFSASEFDFSIASLASSPPPVPLPAAGWLLASGLGVLAVTTRSKSSHARLTVRAHQQ